MQQLKWGLLGTGWIAEQFANALADLPNAQRWSVLSRNQASAESFAQTHQFAHAYSDQAAFLADPELDVVIIGSPHPRHAEQTIACLNAGKHVLCEKPMGINSQQVEAMIAAAQANQRFLMEAMWMWFHPSTIKAKQLLEAGAIGKPHLFHADFSVHFPFDPSHRMYDPALGGGALLDIGIYPLALALYLFGAPTSVYGQAQLGQTGVDEQESIILEYGDDRQANCVASVRAAGPCEATVTGSSGYIRFQRNFWHSQQLLVQSNGQAIETLDLPFIGNGYVAEVAHVAECIQAGLIESPIVTWEASRSLINTMDQLRQSWGITYPDEL